MAACEVGAMHQTVVTRGAGSRVKEYAWQGASSAVWGTMHADNKSEKETAILHACAPSFTTFLGGGFRYVVGP